MALYMLQHCCQGEGSTEYSHPGCGCPQWGIDCSSSEKVVSLCGWEEVDGYKSPLPKKYKTLTIVASGESESQEVSFYCADGADFWTRKTYTATATGSITYNANLLSGCTLEYGSGELVDEWIWRHCNDGNKNEIPGQTTCRDASSPVPTASGWWASNTTVNSGLEVVKSGGCFSGATYIDNRITTWTLDDESEDTEEDALARASSTSGTSCSSLWEKRSTGYSFIKRESEYTINLSALVDGFSYRFKPVIQRRTAVIGSYGGWTDVVTGWQSFTASGTTHTVGPVSLPHLEGYEYKIVSVIIERT